MCLPPSVALRLRWHTVIAVLTLGLTHSSHLRATEPLPHGGGSCPPCSRPPKRRSCTAVLVSAGIELTLFLVAGSVLWFGSSVRIMLIDNTLMFELLLSSTSLKPRTFLFPMLCQQAGVQEAGREHSRGS